jgi:superfamily I DNA/RNA helicase
MVKIWLLSAKVFESCRTCLRWHRDHDRDAARSRFSSIGSESHSITLNQNREVGRLSVRRCKRNHVVVDDYQDVNRSSGWLPGGQRADGRNPGMVGDAKQSIYRFRGASSFNMTRFGKADFPGCRRARLKRNYRSVPGIVDAFSCFATRMLAGFPWTRRPLIEIKHRATIR